MELTNSTSQAVSSGNNVAFNCTVVPGNSSIIHRPGSGLVTLRGLNKYQSRARFRVYFSGNVKADSSVTIGGVTLLNLAIAIDGEAIGSTEMTITVGDTTSTYNVATSTFIDVPTCCCQQISVKNITDDITIDVLNPNLIVERVA